MASFPCGAFASHSRARASTCVRNASIRARHSSAPGMSSGGNGAFSAVSSHRAISAASTVGALVNPAERKPSSSAACASAGPFSVIKATPARAKPTVRPVQPPIAPHQANPSTSSHTFHFRVGSAPKRSQPNARAAQCNAPPSSSAANNPPAVQPATPAATPPQSMPVFQFMPVAE